MSDPDLLRTMEGYLLGTLTAAEREVVEERLLRDTEYCQRVAAVEDDLYDRYAMGDMKASERKLFAARIAAMPDGARRLRAAVALRALQGPRPAHGLFAYAGWGAAACLALVLGGSLWWTARRPIAEPVAVVLRQPGPPAGPPLVMALDLPAVITRGASAPSVWLTAGTALRLRIELREAAARQIAVSVRRAGGAIWTGNAGPATNGIAEVWIPPGVLGSGEYLAVIEGAGPSQICPFRVIAAP
jgi:hypothetical protein